MTEGTLTVENETGLHSRPADLFVRTCKLYECGITVRKGEKEADAKNIIKVILLNVSQYDEITIRCEGPDEQEALADLRRLVESNFESVNEQVKI
jgi:phosphotransferase system HPr (HPr) family protein